MHIIVASSNVFHRELSSFLLNEAGYIVHEFSDATTLLEQFDAIQPSMILLDVRLDGISIIDVAQQIRQRLAAPIMVMTNGSVTVSLQTLRTHSDSHVVWPFQPDDFLAHVHALLDNRASLPAPSS